MKKRKITRVFPLAGFILLLSSLILFWFCLPDPLFTDPTSTVLEDRTGRLLGAKIASDGQWRFPATDSIPENYKKAIIQFEDKYFYSHPGINLISLGRALIQNIRKGEIVSGGSTLSMQVIRLSRKGKPRTIKEKIIEMFMALRLELKYSKSEILNLYASNAPFGGNVVGIDAAAWRYFGRSANDLSWSEVATLAVLPNAPSLIYPGKNQQKLLTKRNRLLKKLLESEVLKDIDYELALEEPLPGKPLSLDQLAPHLLSKVCRTHNGERFKSTIDYRLQKNTSEVINEHHRLLVHNKIYNAAAIVVDVESGEVLSYVGNTNTLNRTDHGKDVDMITAKRSTGSILKPLLYAAMLDEGKILPKTLIPDIPTQFGGFTPMNFDHRYSGAVPADQALYRSLNVPAVKMLQDYGVHRFYDFLVSTGMTSLTNPSDHYGLSLILGGAEVSMWELAGIYSSLSRTLKYFNERSSQYSDNDWYPPLYEIIDSSTDVHEEVLSGSSTIKASSIFFTFDAMRKVNRPEEQAGWELFTSGDKIAWKTGTSYGFRDAWAVGVTPDHVVVVWVGNADGEGRPGLTGVSSAAPILFDIFNLLPQGNWFNTPYDELVKVPVCKKSGYRAGQYCSETDSVYIPETGLQSDACPYHFLVHLDSTETFRVNGECYDPPHMVHRSWFILPPVMEWYYRQIDPGYRVLPEYASSCLVNDMNPMEFLYPRQRTRFYIPKNFDQTSESIVFEVAHREENATLFWHINDDFLGISTGNHQMEVNAKAGKHVVTAIDGQGNSISTQIEILSN